VLGQAPLGAAPKHGVDRPTNYFFESYKCKLRCIRKRPLQCIPAAGNKCPARVATKMGLKRKMINITRKCQDAILWLSICWSPRQQDEEEMHILDSATPAKVVQDCKKGKYGSALKRTKKLFTKYGGIVLGG